MRWTILAPVVCAAIALGLAAPVAAAPSDFRLPPDPEQQQPPPDRQGPVVPDVPASRQQPAPAPTATPSAPAPTPAATAPPVVVPPFAAETPAPQPSRRERPLTTTPNLVSPPAPAETAESAPVDADADVGLGPLATESVANTLPANPLPATTADAGESGAVWPWALASLAILAAIGLAAWLWRRQRQVTGPLAVPRIERPRIAPNQAPAPAAPFAPTAGELLQVAMEPLRLSLTLLNATLAYRLEIANRGLSPIVDLGIGADMIAAHASMTREEQLAGPGHDAGTVQRIERLEPGESHIVEGEFRVPFSQIVPIRRGNAALLLPLARFRLEAEGAAPVVRTFAVGQPGAGAALQPFRLDLGPRVYPKLAQHAFA